MLVDGRDRHRRVMEEPHEADFGGALRIGAVVAGAVEHERARGAGRAVGAVSELVKHPHRQRAPAAGAQIEIEHLGLDLAGRRPQRGQQGGAVAGDEIGELQAARADLGQILIEPIGERGIEIDNLAFVIDREKSGRRMIEIVDGVLQFLKDILLVRALARHVGQATRPSACRRGGRCRAAGCETAASAPAGPWCRRRGLLPAGACRRALLSSSR